LDDSTTARTCLFLGWLEYRQGKYVRAREHFYRALDLARGKRDDWLLGNLYNGLGLLQKREDEYPDALALFRTALDYWCRADYAYGIAAVYANIGTVYKRWGNHLRDHGLSEQARPQYQRAVEWLARCLEFSASARLGEDTSEAQNVLAEVYFELGDFDKAWTMASEAQQVAQKAGNQLDLAEATVILGKLHAVQDDRVQAERFLDDAAARFQRLGHTDRVAEITRQRNARVEKHAPH
jgi:tetratricopeptide (TPR) repeat protein